MTIGQRIAALRKEHHLSQEELGAQAGVSRQAIYKWESDASLPDIDKLIALSKFFGVSVGWLLGVEEPAAENAPQEDAELTEQQLKMVEEIVDRYIAAQPKAQPAKKKKWPYIAGVILLLLVLGNLIGKLNQLDNRYNSLQNSMNNIQYGISNRVEEILKSQNNLTADYDTALLQVDPRANTATFSLRAVPKTYTDGMTATFCATQTKSGEVTKAAGAMGENQTFSAELTCPLSNDITLSVIFTDGDKKETQQLALYDSLYDQTLPTVSINSGVNLIYHDCKQNKLNLETTYSFVSSDSASAPAVYDVITPAQISSVRLGLFKNNKLVSWAEPCDQPTTFIGSYPDGTRFYRLPAMTLNISADDILTIAALVTDEYGRKMVFSEESYQLDEDADELTWATNISWDCISDTDLWQY